MKLDEALKFTAAVFEATEQHAIIMGFRGNQAVVAAAVGEQNTVHTKMELAAKISRSYDADVTVIATVLPHEQALLIAVNKAFDVRLRHTNPKNNPEALRTINEYKAAMSLIVDAMDGEPIFMQAQRDITQLQSVEHLESFSRFQALLDTATQKSLNDLYIDQDIRVVLLGDRHRREDLSYIQQHYCV